MVIGAPPLSGVTTRVEQFGRYTLFGKIAAGGMASVYLAREADGDTDNWYAIKRVHPHLASRKDVLQMFMNEAKILSRLDHHNVCGITDYGIHEDTPFLVMRYLHGAPLSGLLRKVLDLKKPIPVDLMAYVIASTCEGLHYAHDANGESGTPLGLVHRDISPQNIFVTFAGAVKLLDFGVAKAAGFQSFTRTGHIKGKYAYMSPEQVEAVPLDRRSDVFSLGIVLWEMLTGRHLFKRKREIDTLRAITRAVVPAASELNPDVPQALDAIVAKALVGGRTHRYESAQAMGRALWGYLTAAEHPMGSDEVAEIMIATFPDQPAPSEIAQINTQPDAVGLPATDDALPDYDPNDESTGRDHVPRAESATDPPVPWSPGLGVPPGPMEDPTMPLQAIDMNETPLVEDATDVPGVAVPDSEAGGLIPYRVDDALNSPTIANPNLAREVREALAEGDDLLSIPPDEVFEVDGYDDNTVRAEPLRDRPAVSPHPFDEVGRDSYIVDAQDTVLNDPGSTVAMMVTIPKAEISELPVEPDSLGPAIEAAPLSLIDDGAINAREPSPRSWPDVPVRTDERSSTLPWIVLTIALVLASAAVAYWLVLDMSGDDIPPAEELTPEVMAPSAVQADDRSLVRADALYQEGNDAMARGDIATAQEKLLVCVELADLPECHRSLGVAYARKDNVEASVRHYERYLALEPNAADGDQVRTMIAATRTPSSIAPEAIAFHRKGQRALTRGQLGRAEKNLLACVRTEPSYAKCHRALGVLYARRDDGPQSVQHYQKYLDLAPDAPDAKRVQRMLREAMP